MFVRIYLLLYRDCFLCRKKDGFKRLVHNCWSHWGNVFGFVNFMVKRGDLKAHEIWTDVSGIS